MAKLVVTLGEVIQGHYFVDKDRFTIGRKSDNDIALDAPGISKLHAVIITIGNDQVMEDVDSANGVRVNRNKVAKYILQNNDVIEIGDYQLKYMNQRAASTMDFDKTMMLESTPWQVDELAESQKKTVKLQLDTAVASTRLTKEEFPLGGVNGVRGEYIGQQIIISRPLKTFGRPSTGLVMIARRPNGYYVTPVAGKQSTRLNGEHIGAKSHLLHEHDLIEVADQKLQFFIKR